MPGDAVPGRAPVLLSHSASLGHETGAHPERAARIRAIEAELEARDWLGYERVSAPAAASDDLQRVHPAAHIDAIRELCECGGGAIDADTLVSRGSGDAALHAAGGAAALVDRLVDRSASAGISIARPPGHHAEPELAMGFCLFNNVAVAARRALDRTDVERVLVLDWDVHHGNGTSAIFHDSAEVLFVSIHQWPLYPGTGSSRDAGSGAGEGYTINLPVPGGSGDAVFCSLVEHVVVPVARAFSPELVLVSAGYDAHRDDPLADCAVTEDGFRTMTRSVRRMTDELDVGLGAVLEGGYDLGALARSVAETMEELAAPGERPPVELPLHPVAREARARVAGHWPQLEGAAGPAGG